MKKTLLILFVVFAAAALLFVGVVAYMLGAEPGVSKGTVLTIDLSLPVTEKGQAPGIEALLAGSMAHPMPARDIAATIRAAGACRLSLLGKHNFMTLLETLPATRDHILATARGRTRS